MQAMSAEGMKPSVTSLQDMATAVEPIIDKFDDVLVSKSLILGAWLFIIPLEKTLLEELQRHLEHRPRSRSEGEPDHVHRNTVRR